MEAATNLVLGILAHVDAGKTTLAESILYRCGKISKPGRVDHQDAYLDHYELERARGITIFSKQVQIKMAGRAVTLLDTPGHVDFSAEMERSLQIMDAAILVINAADGVQGHTQTLWKLLRRYQIPVFLFVNKMDLPDTNPPELMSELQRSLSEHCLNFNRDQGDGDFGEELALCDEAAIEKYLAAGRLDDFDIGRLIAGRAVFPCYFGSALKMDGVEALLNGIARYAISPAYGADFGARVFKIARDEQNNRLTYLKITGGSLRVKTVISVSGKVAGEAAAEEKVDQIRIYSGDRYQAVQTAAAGAVCAVTGPEHTWPGGGLGAEQGHLRPLLSPVLTYTVRLPEGGNAYAAYSKLRRLEEEEPQLNMTWEEKNGEIRMQVMGAIQSEILKNLIAERFKLQVEFEQGQIVYRETIAAPVIGAGHFEPLRHYAEVHLLMEPLPRGSGLQFENRCRDESLGRNWQRLVMTHLQEKEHKGVLTGAVITDMRIVLLTGRAHQKHTEGGDFRQAVYRAVRQGLMRARSILLEPVYGFQLEVPTDMIGRAMADIRRMKGNFDPPQIKGSFEQLQIKESFDQPQIKGSLAQPQIKGSFAQPQIEGSFAPPQIGGSIDPPRMKGNCAPPRMEMSILTGSAPVVKMQEYQIEVAAYSHGCGKLFCFYKGYEPCHNTADIMAAGGYNPEADQDNPADSVFCAHGAGFIVKWDAVSAYMHVGNKDLGEAILDKMPAEVINRPFEAVMDAGLVKKEPRDYKEQSRRAEYEEKELQEIFRRTYGDGRKSNNAHKHTAEKRVAATVAGENADLTGAVKKNASPTEMVNGSKSAQEYLLVDGYNIIYAWEDLRTLAEVSLTAARDKLADILCNYQGYKENIVILVFDAYRVEGNPGEDCKYKNINIVYTKEAETADMYIEKVTHEIGRKHQVTVATSDLLEQMIVWGQGAYRLSAAGLKEEIEQENINGQNKQLKIPAKNYLFDRLPAETAQMMEEVRLGKRQFGKK